MKPQRQYFWLNSTTTWQVLIKLLCIMGLLLFSLGSQVSFTWAQENPVAKGLGESAPPNTRQAQKDKVDVGAKAKEDAERREKEIKEIIRYGIDSDLVAIIQTLLRETPHLPIEDEKYQRIEETPYNNDIYQRIQKGYSSNELQAESIHFFMQQKWLDAEDYIIEIVSREGNIDNNLLLKALAYLRNLEVRKSEDAVIALLNDENPQIVEQSIRSLGKIGSAKSAADLLNLLEDKENSFTEFTAREQEILRVAAIQSLGNLSYSEASSYFLQILADTKNEDREYSNIEWGAAAKALGQLQNPQAIELILTQFRNGNTQQRYQAIMAISAFPLQAEFEDIILQGLQEAYWKTRKESAKTAGELKLQSAIPSLAYKVARDSVIGVRRAAIRALRQMGAAGSSALRKLVQSPDAGETQRLDVLRILVQAQDNAAVEIFRQLLDDQDNISRSGLFRVASNNPWSALDFVYQEMLSDRQQKIRTDALRAIARAKLTSMRATVQELAENAAESSVRRAAQNTLSSINY